MGNMASKSLAPEGKVLSYNTALSETYQPFVQVFAEAPLAMEQSSDGRWVYMITSTGLYVSDDYGINFSLTVEAALNSLVVCSANGKYSYCVLSSTGELQRDDNYGAGPGGTSVMSPVPYIVLSESGQYVITTGTGTGPSIRYFLSNDYGVTFTEHALTPGMKPIMSKDGKYQFITEDTTGILYYSNDYGQTWVAQADDFVITEAKCSESGQYLIATNGTNYCYSIDYGVTWGIEDRLALASLTSATISPNGSTVVVGQDDVGVPKRNTPSLGLTPLVTYAGFNAASLTFISSIVDRYNQKILSLSLTNKIYDSKFGDYSTQVLPDAVYTSLFANKTLQYVYTTDGVNLYRAYKKNILTITPTTEVHEIKFVENGVTSAKVNIVNDSLTGIYMLTQAEYDALESIDPMILYYIKTLPI